MSSLRGNAHHAAPEYGRDLSIFEAIGNQRNFASTQLSQHGVEFKVNPRALQSNVEVDDFGSMKLASFLLHNYELLPVQTPEPGYVLDLDCRNGFAGIAALQLGYQLVIFTEASPQVLRNATWPNIVLNCPNSLACCRCVLSGSWVALSELLSVPGENKWTPLYLKFELMTVTVPTVHNLLLWEKLHSLLQRHLTPTGMAVVNVSDGISSDGSVPLCAALSHSMFQSVACVGSSSYDIVLITRRTYDV